MGARSRWVLFFVAATAIVGAVYLGRDYSVSTKPELPVAVTVQPQAEKNFKNGPVRLWYTQIPENILKARVDPGRYSNIMKADYVGPETCKECHAENYEMWHEHAHRSMNLLANENTVQGDFSGTQTITYMGGEGRFFRQDGRYLMELHRDDVRRLFEATRTLGSRFFQYYVGKQIGGPAFEANASNTDHVLPFGFWLSAQQWVPTVHVTGSDSDVRPYDPFAAPPVVPYAVECSSCHTTRPFGDSLVTRIWDDAEQVFPRRLDFQLASFLEEAHPQLWNEAKLSVTGFDQQIDFAAKRLMNSSAVTHAASLGITCEACHLGLAQHVDEHEEYDPRFYPSSIHAVVTPTSAQDNVFGRTSSNIQHVCGRCHAGDRPRYANGIGTWNSTEFSDAIRGSCYSKMTCLNCHDPHKGIGKAWTKTPEEDDASCLSCHKDLQEKTAGEKHTHHPFDSTGSRCMNCHMPRINEGLEHMVRTHTIFKPTNKAMIEAGQANACNLCHLDKSINWTLEHLEKRYGRKYNEQRISTNYIDRTKPAVLSWLKYSSLPTPQSGQTDEASNAAASTRLTAAFALLQAKQRWALPYLIESLNDEGLLNRQLTQKYLEEWLDLKLSKWGYVFYQTPTERREPLLRIKKALLKGAKK